jgi:hypothetical protein
MRMRKGSGFRSETSASAVGRQCGASRWSRAMIRPMRTGFRAAMAFP